MHQGMQLDDVVDRIQVKSQPMVPIKDVSTHGLTSRMKHSTGFLQKPYFLLSKWGVNEL